MDIGYRRYYHVCSKRDWFASFEKLDRGIVQMGDDHTCSKDGIDMVFIKMFNGMVRALKDVRYIPQINENLISIGSLEAQGLEYTGRDGVLKVLKDSMIVLKGISRNNLYYLKDNIIIRQLMTLVGTNDDSTGLCHKRLRRTYVKSLQALARK